MTRYGARSSCQTGCQGSSPSAAWPHGKRCLPHCRRGRDLIELFARLRRQTQLASGGRGANLGMTRAWPSVSGDGGDWRVRVGQPIPQQQRTTAVHCGSPRQLPARTRASPLASERRRRRVGLLASDPASLPLSGTRVQPPQPWTLNFPRDIFTPVIKDEVARIRDAAAQLCEPCTTPSLGLFSGSAADSLR